MAITKPETELIMANLNKYLGPDGKRLATMGKHKDVTTALEQAAASAPSPEEATDIYNFTQNYDYWSKEQKAIKSAIGGKVKKMQEGGSTATGYSVEQRAEPILTEIKKQAGFTPATPPSLPTGTELAYTPQTLQTNELISAGQTATTAAPQVTTPTTQAPVTVATPSTTAAPTVTTAQPTDTPEITGVSGTVSTSAQITPPTGTVDPNSLVTAQQGSEASALAQTRTIASDEIVDAATLSDIGVNAAAQSTAAQQTTPTTTVKAQLENLQGLFADGQVPDFAKGVVTTVNNMLSARGLGASSIAGEALTAGVMQQLVPIAMADAQIQQKLDLTNLTHAQQTAVTNAQLRASFQSKELDFEQQERVINTARINEINKLNLNNQQMVALENSKLSQNMKLSNLNNNQQAAIQNAATYASMDARNLGARVQSAQQNANSFLSMDMKNLTNAQQAQTLNQQYRTQQYFTEAAQENATRQFNARSQTQVDQFFAQLGTAVAESNATRADRMSQFNVEQGVAVEKFNSEVQDIRDRFNSQAAAVIDQSNTQWRRSINTANNTNTNRVLQQNAQNLLALTQGSQNALWQRYRDEAQWAMTSAENTLSRAHAAAVAGMNQDFQREMYSEKYKDYVNAQLGQFAYNTIGTIVNKVLG